MVVSRALKTVHKHRLVVCRHARGHPVSHPVPCAWPRCRVGLARFARAWPWSSTASRYPAAPPHCARRGLLVSCPRPAAALRRCRFRPDGVVSAACVHSVAATVRGRSPYLRRPHSPYRAEVTRALTAFLIPLSPLSATAVGGPPLVLRLRGTASTEFPAPTTPHWSQLTGQPHLTLSLAAPSSNFELCPALCR
jgi:hypothetical protein